MTYSATNPYKGFRDQLIILFLRGIYGIIVALMLHTIFSADLNIILVLKVLFGDYYNYFTWIYLLGLYPVSIVIIKLLTNAKRKYDLYLRGISVYFASAIITYTIISTP